MPPAARVLDPTAHAGVVTGPGVPTVLITGLAAAVVGDVHTCGLAPTPHPPAPFAMGSFTVFIGGRPALRVGDVAACGAPIIVGAPTVLIG
jgi:uncharacterized Zn-binding protein involved in type VI secretion